jgi:hypothetical protein
MAANARDAETIERDIDRTQDRIGDTVEKIEEKMNPSEITRSILGDDGQESVRNGLRIARENPIPVALIAIGAVWLFATSDTPMIRRVRERLIGGGSATVKNRHGLIPRTEEPAPIGPPPTRGEEFDRRSRNRREAEASA